MSSWIQEFQGLSIRLLHGQVVHARQYLLPSLPIADTGHTLDLQGYDQGLGGIRHLLRLIPGEAWPRHPELS